MRGGWMASFSMNNELEKLQELAGQVGLACLSPWGCKDLDTNYKLIIIELNILERESTNIYSNVITTSQAVIYIQNACETTLL